MRHLFAFILQICIIYKLCGLKSGLKIDLEAVCKSGKHPTESAKSVCAYWIGDAHGTNEARLVHNKGIHVSLHGYFPAKLKPALPSIPYEKFVTKLKSDLNLTNFIDVASSTNYTCCCSQYHEYTKHGSKSGYTYSEWLNGIKDCIHYLYPLDTDSFKKVCSPDFCHFNGSVNFVEECFIGDDGAYDGCKRDNPFIFPDL